MPWACRGIGDELSANGLISLDGLMHSLARILAQIMHCGWGRDSLLRENEIKP